MSGLAIPRQLFRLLRHWPWLHYPREILLILSALRRVRLNSPSRFNSVHRKLKDNRDRRRSSAIGPDGPHQGSRLTLRKNSRANNLVSFLRNGKMTFEEMRAAIRRDVGAEPPR